MAVSFSEQGSRSEGARCRRPEAEPGNALRGGRRPHPFDRDRQTKLPTNQVTSSSGTLPSPRNQTPPRRILSLSPNASRLDEAAMSPPANDALDLLTLQMTPGL